MLFYIGFAWPGFGCRWTNGVSSVRSWQKLHPCPAEPLPLGSKMNVLLIKAGPIRNGRNTFVIFKKGKKSYSTDVIAAREETSEKM